MCQWKSAVVGRTGRIYHSPWTDSHEDIIAENKLKDGDKQHIVRVEFSPDAPENIANIKKYSLKLDETSAPGWWDEEMQEKVRQEMEEIVSACILKKKTIPILMGGCWILVDCKIDKVDFARVPAMWGGTLNTMRGGTLNTMCDGTLNAMWGGTLNAMWGGTLNAMWGGTLNAMRGGTLIKDFREK